MNAINVSPHRLESFGRSFVRYALVIILLWIGLLKFTVYEAKNIDPLVSHSFLFAWLYNLVGLRMLANLLGVAEIVIGLLIASRNFSPFTSALGGIGAIIMFATTLTFLFTTPGAWQPGYGFPFPSGIPGQFVAKDLLFLAVAIWLTGESLQAARAREIDGRASGPGAGPSPAFGPDAR